MSNAAAAAPQESILGGKIDTPVTPDPAATPPAAGAQAPEVHEWMKGLPDELKGDASLARFKSVDDLATSYLSARKMIGQDKIALPNPKTATDADYLAVYKKLGLPESADKYEVKVEGANPKLLDGFKKLALETGILPKQGQKVLDYYNEINKAAQADAEAKTQAQRQEWAASLKKEWGDGYEKEVLAARVALKEFGDESVVELLQGGLGDHPGLVKLLSRVGKALKEDDVKGEASGKQFGMTPQEIDNELASIMANPNYFSEDRLVRTPLVNRAMELRALKAKGA